MCCCPIKSLINKFAFNPPQPPTYHFVKKEDRIYFELYDNAFETNFGNISQRMTAFFVQPNSKTNIACLLIRGSIGIVSEYTGPLLLISHGNSCDLGSSMPFLVSLSNRLHVDVLCYDYSGYGQSSGRPNRFGLKKNIEYVFDYALKLGYPLESIIVYGESLGSVPSIHLASKYSIGALVVHSGLLSGLKTACNNKAISCGLCDVFRNERKIRRIKAPTLIIHGTEDTVIPCSHGRRLFKHLLNPLDPLFLIGAKHDNVETFPEYSLRMQRFINLEIPYNPRRLNVLTSTSSYITEQYDVIPICNENWPRVSSTLIPIDTIDSGLDGLDKYIKQSDQLMVKSSHFMQQYKQREISWMCSDS